MKKLLAISACATACAVAGAAAAAEPLQDSQMDTVTAGVDFPNVNVPDPNITIPALNLPNTGVSFGSGIELNFSVGAYNAVPVQSVSIDTGASNGLPVRRISIDFD